MKRRAFLEPHPEYRVMYTTSAPGIHTLEPKILESTFQLTYVARGVIDIVSLQPFRVFFPAFPR